MTTDPMKAARAALYVARRTFGEGGEAAQTRRQSAGTSMDFYNPSTYTPPELPPRAISTDYPKGLPLDEQGNLFKTIEGRPLTAKIVAGRSTVGGSGIHSDRGIDPQTIERLGTEAGGASFLEAPPSALRGASGELEAWRDPKTGERRSKIRTRNDLSPEFGGNVRAHEVGHLLDWIINKLPVPSKGPIRSEMEQIYHRLSTNKTPKPGWESKYGLHTPEANGYFGEKADRELAAESIRAYMSNPNYIKTTAPRVASLIRKHFNEHPHLSKFIQFNSAILSLLGSSGMYSSGGKANSKDIRAALYVARRTFGEGGIALEGFAGGGTTDDDYFTAYHGTPHTFEPEPDAPYGRFRDAAIGSGEGAQAYGHGHYLAGSEEVAGLYRKALSGAPVTSEGVSPRYLNKKSKSLANSFLQQSIDMKLNKDDALRDAMKRLHEDANFVEVNRKQEYYDAINSLSEMLGKEWSINKGHLLQVRVRAKPEHFLDWDKPLSEQNHILDKIDHHIGDPEIVMQRLFPDPSKATGRDLHDALGGKHKPKEVSEKLRQMGIPGIRYLDAGSRGPTGAPTHNYVVFDPKDIDIMKRYAQGGEVYHGHAPGHRVESAVDRALHMTRGGYAGGGPISAGGGPINFAPAAGAFAGLSSSELPRLSDATIGKILAFHDTATGGNIIPLDTTYHGPAIKAPTFDPSLYNLPPDVVGAAKDVLAGYYGGGMDSGGGRSGDPGGERAQGSAAAGAHDASAPFGGNKEARGGRIHRADGGETYKDPESRKMAGWNWRPLSEVREQLGDLHEIPSHVANFGQFMDETARRAATNGLTPRDLIKAYTITRSSIQREARSADKARSSGVPIPHDFVGDVRPEGAFGEWLHSPMGRRYLDAAERGIVDREAVEHAVNTMKPFGLSTEAHALPWAAQNLPQHAAAVSDMVARAMQRKSSPEEWRNFIGGVHGIGHAKAGFMGSLLGRGDQPTLDARQVVLHTGRPTSEAKKPLARAGSEAVDRLAARQEAMGLKTPEGLEPYYQHLAHHAVWDKVGNEQTTHQDVINAMRHAATGGAITPPAHTHPLAQAMAEVGLPMIDPLGRATFRKMTEENKQIQPINQRMLDFAQLGLRRQPDYGLKSGGAAKSAIAIARSLVKEKK